MFNKQLSIFKQSNKSCAFTGHRIIQKDFSKIKLKKEILKLIKTGINVFYCGMALGFDLIACETVLNLKKKYKDIKIIACIPCSNQDQYFSQEDKLRYANLLEKVDEKVILANAYYNGCMQKRNIYMCDRADVLLCYLRQEKGGTAQTVNYFKRKYPEKTVIGV